MRSIAVVLMACCIALSSAETARAQEGTVRGVVTDTAGKPIVEADVSIVALHKLTRTDAEGHFVLPKLPRGEHEVSVRRLGYGPQTIKVAVNDMAYSYSVTLIPQPLRIAGIEINPSEERLRLGIEEFYRRRARGMGGTYYTRDDISAQHARQATDLIRNAPGVRIVRTRGITGVRFSGSASSSSRRECGPVIWLDGQEVQGMEIDQIPLNDVEGLEVYSGPSTIPTQFSPKQSRDACGAIVIWTRIPGRP